MARRRAPATRSIQGFVALLAVALATTATAETVTVLPSKDNTIYAGAQFETNSCGAGSGIVAGNTNNGLARRALLQFGSAATCAVPPGSTITGATVTLTTDRSRAGAAFPMTLHRLLADWGEGPTNCDANPGQGAPAAAGEATWLHRFFSATLWATAGGDFSATASGSGLVGTAGGPYPFTGAGLASDLQGWLSAPATNFGWELVGAEGANQTATRFLSREGSAPPTLAITYTPPPGVEACCFGCAGVLGDCVLATAADCAGRGGVTQAGVSACLPDTCPQEPGACCVPSADTNYACQEVTQAQCAGLGGSFHGAGTRCGTNVCGLAPWMDPLPRPAVATPVSGTPGGTATYTIPMTRFQQQLHRDLRPTWVYGYAGSFPGPTIEASTGQPVTVNWVNDLRRNDGALLPIHDLAVDQCAHGPDVWRDTPRTVVHLHGGHVPPRVDGLPEYEFLPGSSDTYVYPNAQQASTLWYHDHALGITRLNVTMGLAGFYIVRDPVERALALPTGAWEVPLVIQDRNFNLATGEIVYPQKIQQMFHGENILVNGKVWPFLNVDQGKYRFRVLNGSSTRTYTLYLPHPTTGQSLPLTVIGTEGGLYAAPRTATEITLAPAERLEVIVDFAGFARNTQLILKNKAVTDFPVGMAPMGGTQNVLKFIVGRRTGFTGPVPATLRPFTAIPAADASVTRAFNLVRMDTPEPCAGGEWLIQSLDAAGNVLGQHWDDLSDFPVLGKTEIWEFKNASTVMHPIHVHLVHFQILNRQKLDAAGNPTGPMISLDPLEAGAWKETVRANPGEVVRVIARFEDFAGRYPYHCHIIEHEDHEMMRQFQSMHDPAQCVPNDVCEPNEDCQSCPADCAQTRGAYCGNGLCEAADGETCTSCPLDCPTVAGVCCGEGGTCDAACSTNGFYCRDHMRVLACCGDQLCEGGEIGSATCGDCNFVLPPPMPPPPAPPCATPGAPASVTATVRKSTVTVAWTPPAVPPTGGFRVSRSIGPSGTPALVGSEGPNATSFRDGTTVAGTQYCYTVRSWNDCDANRAFGAGDTESGPSNQVCVTR